MKRKLLLVFISGLCAAVALSGLGLIGALFYWLLVNAGEWLKTWPEEWQPFIAGVPLAWLVLTFSIYQSSK